MMLDAKCEYVNSSTCVNLSAMWTMDPTMATQLGRYELKNKSYSSGDDIYDLVDSSDD